MTENTRIFWGMRTFCVITGASRGIGQEIAYQFAKKFKEGSVVLLLSRTDSGLQDTKARILSNCPAVNVKTVSTDLYQPNNETYYSLISNCLNDYNLKPGDFEHAMMVHNAGVMLNNTPVATTDNLDMLHDDMNVNLYSTVSLNVQFLKIFTGDAVAKRSVIQTSSIAAFMPLPGSGFYCMAKAARNMYFKALASEDTTLDVLSFGPGPVETDMLRSFERSLDEKSLNDFRKLDLTLTCEQSVKWLVGVLTEGSYVSGDFKDIYTAEEYGGIVRKAE